MNCGGINSALSSVIAWLLLLPSFAWADSWAAPRVVEVFSESRERFVRMLPGENLGATIGFAGAKKGRTATAEFYRRARDHSYQRIAEVSLLNPISPVELLVANNGHLVAVDNWHNLGYGQAVSLYDATGNLIRSYGLRDLFQSQEIANFPHSVSSIHWRSGPVYIRSDQKTALITVRSGAEFVFGLETARFKYCEYQNKEYRCRNSNDPRRWLPNGRLPLNR